MYETFEHTADVGLRVSAPSLDELFAAAARGLFSLLVSDPIVGNGETMSFEVSGDNLTFLLVDILSELLFTFESEEVVLGDFVFKVGDGRASATATARALDPKLHGPAREVKAITYHAAAVRHTEEGWDAELILDV